MAAPYREALKLLAESYAMGANRRGKLLHFFIEDRQLVHQTPPTTPNVEPYPPLPVSRDGLTLKAAISAPQANEPPLITFMNPVKSYVPKELTVWNPVMNPIGVAPLASAVAQLPVAEPLLLRDIAPAVNPKRSSAAKLMRATPESRVVPVPLLR